MNGDELERRLTGAFDARAHDAVPDSRRPPAFDDRQTGHMSDRPRRRLARLAPLAAAAAVVLVAGGIALFHDSSGHHAVAGAGPSVAEHTLSSPASSPAAKAGAVHVKLKFGDGAHVGVGMPVIAYFSRAITSAKTLSTVTTATVNGTPVHGAWYFEESAADPQYPIEGHFRLAKYWPAHANIVVGLPIQGLSAGPGLTYDDSLTVDFATGAANVATVYDRKHEMVVTADGRTVGTYPVSLGAAASPTSRGTKVIMEKAPDISIKGPGYDEPHVLYTQRLTYDGEYLHAAPWNLANIGTRDSSPGSTNLRTADARALYARFEIGDVVRYPDTAGPDMQLGDGYGDWNVSWSQWQTGGLVPTR